MIFEGVWGKVSHCILKKNTKLAGWWKEQRCTVTQELSRLWWNDKRTITGYPCQEENKERKVFKEILDEIIFCSIQKLHTKFKNLFGKYTEFCNQMVYTVNKLVTNTSYWCETQVCILPLVRDSLNTIFLVQSIWFWLSEVIGASGYPIWGARFSENHHFLMCLKKKKIKFTGCFLSLTALFLNKFSCTVLWYQWHNRAVTSQFSAILPCDTLWYHMQKIQASGVERREQVVKATYL